MPVPKESEAASPASSWGPPTRCQLPRCTIPGLSSRSSWQELSGSTRLRLRDGCGIMSPYGEPFATGSNARLAHASWPWNSVIAPMTTKLLASARRGLKPCVQHGCQDAQSAACRTVEWLGLQHLQPRHGKGRFKVRVRLRVRRGHQSAVSWAGRRPSSSIVGALAPFAAAICAGVCASRCCGELPSPRGPAASGEAADVTPGAPQEAAQAAKPDAHTALL